VEAIDLGNGTEYAWAGWTLTVPVIPRARVAKMRERIELSFTKLQL